MSDLINKTNFENTIFLNEILMKKIRFLYFSKIKMCDLNRLKNNAIIYIYCSLEGLKTRKLNKE